MRKTLLISFAALLWTGIAAAGQDTLRVNGRTAAFLIDANTIGAQTAERYSVAAILSAPLPSLTEAEVRFICREEDEAFLPQEGDGLYKGEFHVQSTVHLDEESAVQGGVSYQRGVKKHVVWNTASDFGLLYPYVMADSVGGHLQQEQYAFFGKYARSAGAFVFGAEGDYRALHEYRQADPRTRNITSDFTGKGTFGCRFGGYMMDCSAAYRKYHQSQHVIFVDQRGANTAEFHFTGLGSHFSRFAGAGAFTNIRYRGSGFSVSAALHPLQYQGLYAGAEYAWFNSVRHLVNQNEAPITELLTQHLSAFVSGRAARGDWRFGTELRGIYELRQGTENVIDNVATGSYESLMGMTLYRNRIYQAEWKGSAAWRRPCGVWSLLPKGRWYAMEAKYLYPERKMAVRRVSAGVQAGFLRDAGRWMTALCAGAEGNMSAGGTFSIPAAFTVPGIWEFYKSQYAKFTDDWMEFSASARVQRELRRNAAIYARASVARLFFRSGDRSGFLTAAIGFAF